MPTKTKAAPAPEVDETDEVELEELESDEVSDTATPRKSGGQEVTFGVADLAAHLSSKDKKVTPRELRVLIRKMARDSSNRVQREIVPGNRSRYNWSGVNDPEVQAIIAAYNAGELDADKKEKLDALKARKAEQVAAKKAAAEAAAAEAETEEDEDEPTPAPAPKARRSNGKRKTAAPAPVVEEDDEELDLDDDE